MRGRTRTGKLLVIAFAVLSIPVLATFLALARRVQRETEARHHNNLGVALLEALQDSSETEFEAALRLYPGFQAARFNRALAVYRKPGEVKSVGDLEALLREAPESLPVRYLLGLFDKRANRWQEAAEHFRAVIAKDPADGRTWLHLGTCWTELKRPEEALEAFVKAAARLPESRSACFRLSRALIAAGRREEGAEELARFKELQKKRNLDGQFQPDDEVEPPTSSGKYDQPIAESGSGIEMPDPEPDYQDFSRQAGLDFRNGAAVDHLIREVVAGKPMPRSWFEDTQNRGRLLAALGTGASLPDYNNDGSLDIFLVHSGWRHVLLEGDGRGHFADVTSKAGLLAGPAAGMACAWGDYDNDGWNDLFISGYGHSRLYQNQHGKLTDVTEASGIAERLTSRTWCMGAAFADVDHDGDLDLLVSCLVDISTLPQKDPLEFPRDFAAQPLLLFENHRLGPFTEVGGKAFRGGPPAGTRAVRSTDLNGDEAIDVVVYDLRGRAEAWINRRDGTFDRSASPPPPCQLPPPGESWALGDFDRDGAVDRLVNRSGERAVLERNRRAPANWLTVRLHGRAPAGDVPSSNRPGVGSLVEARAVGMWRRKELLAGNGTQGSDAAEVTFDLGRTKKLDFVRALFPSGARTSQREVGANQVITIEEIRLARNSCPALFSWDGERFRFLTDTLSAGILGELVAPGEHWKPDPDEWLCIASDELRPRTDAAGEAPTLEIRFTNPLEEVVYLDQVRLVAVDHPSGLEVFPGERMVSEPRNRVPARFYALRGLRPVAGATGPEGGDATERLARADRVYVSPPKLLPFEGFAEDWSLELDLGAANAGTRPEILLLHSWSGWSSSASIVAAAQEGKRLWGPILEVLGNDGKWRAGLDDLGVSAGLPRAILVDLRDVLRGDERVVRIRSDRTLHYDQAVVGEVGEVWDPEPGKPAVCRQTPVPLRSADLRWLGYPARSLPGGSLPEVYDYAKIEPRSDWGTHRGLLTRYGEVASLLGEADDLFAVFSHGEEVALRFGAETLPALPEGWKRTFLFYSVGYEKGRELYAAHSRTVGPLPFRGMEAYPAAGPEPAMDEKRLDYLLEWNTRPSVLSGWRP